MSVQTKIGGKVFGELTLQVLSAKSIDLLDTEVILPQPFELVTLKNGSIVTLAIHEIFVKNKNAHSNTADIQLVISYDVVSELEKEAFFEVNSKINEETILMKLFELETYDDSFSFLVTGLTVNWYEFLHSDEF